MSLARRILREPLLHFALLGGALFGVYRLVSPRPMDASAIVISSDQIVAIAEQFRGVWQRAPTRAELDRLIEARVRDEILYREGVALGLDRDDPVVRSRVKQKMEVLAEDALTAEPTAAELQAYLDAHPALFELPAAVSFDQVYFDPARRDSALESDMRYAREVLSAGGRVAGDPTMLPKRMEHAPPADVQATFGAAFEAAVRAAPAGTWSEPVRSSFGYHLVRVTERTAARAPTLADAHDAVLREWSRARAAEAQERLYRSLRSRYSVEIAPITEAVPLTASAKEPR
jgi:hypothetical protein